MAPLSASKLRAINLIELLREERAGRGPREGGEVPEEAVDWTEESIRAWFSEERRRAPPEARGDVEAFARDAGGAPPRPPSPPGETRPSSDLDVLRSRWFPSAPRLAKRPPDEGSVLGGCGGPVATAAPRENPAFVLVAFACAGSSEDLFSSEGSGPRRSPSSLLRWLRDRGGLLLSVQLPGRGGRRGEPMATSAAEVAREVVSLVAAEVTSKTTAAAGPSETTTCVPWFIAGHSLGAWLAFELASSARDIGLHPPLRLLLSAMPPPHTPRGRRPWTGPAATMPREDFAAECRAWGISEVVFSPGVWEEYEPLLRGDFRLFDEYEFVRGADPPLPSKLTFFFGDEDPRVPEHVSREWERYAKAPAAGDAAGESGQERETLDAAAADANADAAYAADETDIIRVVRRRGNFELVRVVGGRHLWPLDKKLKAPWLYEVAKRMASDLGLPGPERPRE